MNHNNGGAININKQSSRGAEELKLFKKMNYYSIHGTFMGENVKADS